MNGEFAGAWRLQTTIVHALMRRDTQARNARTRLGLLMEILEPAAMIFTIIAMRYYVTGGGRIYGVPMALFVTTGYMPYHFFRLGMSKISAAARNKTPTLMFPQVTTFDAIVARGMEMFVSYTAAMVLSFTLVGVIFKCAPQDMLLILISMSLDIWVASAVGILVGVASRFFPVIGIVLPPLMRLLILFSGALYLATEIPPQLLVYVRWNPLFHIIEMMREGWLEGYVSPVEDPSYVVTVSIILTALAMWTERATRRFKFS